MALIDRKITDTQISTNGVVSAPDKLIGTAAQNKAIFDNLIKTTVKTELNGVIDDLTATTDGASGADQLGATAISGLTGATVQSLLEALKGLANTTTSNVTAAQLDIDTHEANVSNPHSVTKSQIGLSNADNTSDVNKPVSTAAQTALDLKVDKVTGKVLSTNDYTTAEQTKLSGIATGAEVNVNADWNAASGDAQVLNKPLEFTPSAHTQAASTITDFDTEVSNNTDVAANTTARHSHTNKTILDNTTASYITAEQTKLAGVASGATANSADATLLARANHTGTQSADTIVDGTTNKSYTATEKTKLAAIAGTNTGDQTISTPITATLAFADWVGSAAPYTQTIAIAGMTATKDYLAGLPDITPTRAQINACAAAQLRVTDKDTNTITLTADGTKPSLDIPIVVTLLG